jgi:hypothetical protein
MGVVSLFPLISPKIPKLTEKYIAAPPGRHKLFYRPRFGKRLEAFRPKFLFTFRSIPERPIQRKSPQPTVLSDYDLPRYTPRIFAPPLSHPRQFQIRPSDTTRATCFN